MEKATFSRPRTRLSESCRAIPPLVLPSTGRLTPWMDRQRLIRVAPTEERGRLQPETAPETNYNFSTSRNTPVSRRESSILARRCRPDRYPVNALKRDHAVRG